MDRRTIIARGPKARSRHMPWSEFVLKVRIGAMVHGISISELCRRADITPPRDRRNSHPCAPDTHVAKLLPVLGITWAQMLAPLDRYTQAVQASMRAPPR